LGREAHNLKSEHLRSITLVRISSPPRATVYLVDCIKTLLETASKHLMGKVNIPPIPASVLVDVSRRVESTIKSARGVEYSKASSSTTKKPEITLGVDSPGVEFQRKVTYLVLEI
jgi:hypothetical protein